MSGVLQCLPYSHTMTCPDFDNPPVFEALEPRMLFAATPLGEAGSVTFGQADASSWTTVQLHRDYINPVVIATTQTLNGSDPFTLRVRNITAGAFEIQIDEWDYLDGVHATPETIGYLVIEAGAHTLDDGTVLQAGFTSADDGTTTVSLPSAHGATPVVLTQVSSVDEADAVVTRVDSVTTSGFTLELMEQEPTKGPHVSETVGWVSIDLGSGATGERLFEAGDTGDTVTHSAQTQALTQSFAGVPVVLAGMQSLDGGDPAATHVLNTATGSFQTLVQEEQAGDTDTAHTTETIGFLAWSTGLINLGANTAPVTASDSYSTSEDVALSVPAVAGVLSNDADPELGPLDAVLVSGPSNGSLTLNADGSFVYTPNADFFGTDSFAYQAVDLESATATAVVTLTVSPVDDAPIALDDMATVDEDAVLVGDVSGNDVELDGDPVTFALVSDVLNGTLAFNGDGTFVYTPDADVNGGDSFTYRIADDQGGSETATVLITVNAVNDAPELTSLGAFGIGPDDPAVLWFALADVDAGGSVMRLQITVDGGFVSLPSALGVAWVVGDGVDDVSVTLDGTLAQLSQALTDVRVSAAGVLIGIDVSVTVDDLGATGSGGALQSLVTLTVGLRLPEADGQSRSLGSQDSKTHGLGDAFDPSVHARKRLLDAAVPGPALLPVGYTVERTLIALPDGALVTASEPGVDDLAQSQETSEAPLTQVDLRDEDGLVAGVHTAATEEMAADVNLSGEHQTMEASSLPIEPAVPSETLADVPVVPGSMMGWVQAASGGLLLAWVKATERFQRRGKTNEWRELRPSA